MQLNTFASGEDVREYAEATFFRNSKGMLRRYGGRFFLVFAAVFVAVALFTQSILGRDDPFGTIIFGLSTLGAGLGLFMWLATRLTVRTLERTFEKVNKNSTFTMNEMGITTQSADEGQYFFFNWQYIGSMMETENLYIFITINNIGVFFNKQWLEGREAEFLQIVNAHILPPAHKTVALEEIAAKRRALCPPLAFSIIGAQWTSNFCP